MLSDLSAAPSAAEQIGNSQPVLLLRQIGFQLSQNSGASENLPFRRLTVSARHRWILFPYRISERSACNVKGLTAALEF